MAGRIIPDYPQSNQPPTYRYPLLTEDMRSKGLVQCDHCDAIYRKSKNWVRGYSIKGSTTGEFFPQTRVDEDKCPWCNKPESKGGS